MSIRLHENVAPGINLSGVVKGITQVGELLIKDDKSGENRYFELSKDGKMLSTKELIEKFEIGDKVIVANGGNLEEIRRNVL